MRNLSIALALAINAFGPQGAGAALVVALSYVVQVQAAAWYVKYTDRIFGSAVPAASAAEPTAEATVPLVAMDPQRSES
jgi:predicted Na+-dependent transporter